MTDYLNTPADQIPLSEAAAAITYLQNEVTAAATAANGVITDLQSQLTASGTEVAGLRGQLAEMVQVTLAEPPTVCAAPTPEILFPQKVQVLHARPEGNFAMNILNVGNDGTTLTVTVN